MLALKLLSCIMDGCFVADLFSLFTSISIFWNVSSLISEARSSSSSNSLLFLKDVPGFDNENRLPPAPFFTLFPVDCLLVE